MDTHTTTRGARRLALTLVVAMAFFACTSGGEPEGGDGSTETSTDAATTTDSASTAMATETSTSETATESSTTEPWYVNPSDVRASGFPSMDDVKGLVIDETGNLACITHPTDVVVWTPDLEPGSALDVEIQQVLDDRGPGYEDGPVELGDDHWIYTVPDAGAGAEAGSNPLLAAQSLNDGLGDTLRASPDYRMFPMPARMFFPGNWPEPSDSASPLPLKTVGEDEAPAPRIHVIDTGLSAVGLPGDVGGEVDPRSLADSPGEVGHGTFISGVVSQNSDAPVTNWVVPDPDVELDPDVTEFPFHESDVLAAARRVRNSAGTNPTITNLSLGTVACQHDLFRGEDPADEYPLLSLLTMEVLTEGTSVVLAAAGNTGPVDGPTGDVIPTPLSIGGNTDPAHALVYPAALTVPLGDRQGCSADVESAGICVDIEPRREDVAPRIVAVGANDHAGWKEEWYSSEGQYVTTSEGGCHTSFYLSGVAVYSSISLPTESPKFLDATPDDTGSSYSLAHWCGTSFSTAVASARLAEKLQELRTQAGDDQDLTPADALAELGWKSTQE